MQDIKKIKAALISVYHKDEKIESIIKELDKLDIKLFSTGGTYDFIKKLGIEAIPVENITSYPSILGGRVKTLHPKIFGGILSRRGNADDNKSLKEYDIPEIDLVIVDLYPFEETVESQKSKIKSQKSKITQSSTEKTQSSTEKTQSYTEKSKEESQNLDEEEIIEKIDIGGISLIRAGAKNFNDVVIVPSSAYYEKLLKLLEEKKGETGLEERKYFAKEAFNVSSHYDTAIFNWFTATSNQQPRETLHATYLQEEPGKENKNVLRYGENPHQKGTFYGDMEKCFTKLHGKELSYNNLIDIDAAINLINEFKVQSSKSQESTFAIIKHTNACGVATSANLTDAWKAALAGDPVSAYGGIIITNSEIVEATSEEINKLFFEVIISPGYKINALELLKSKKNRIILQNNQTELPQHYFKTVLNGVIEQDRDSKIERLEDLKIVTIKSPTEEEKRDMLFGNIIVKHNKSNAIVLVKNRQLLGIGTGQTSRVDATEQAIAKAKRFGFELQGAILASDAFFPFSDCAELAYQAGITAIIQPGGSVRDKDSIDNCNKNNISMVFTGFRHFKH